MHYSTKKADSIASNPWFIILGNVCSITALVWFSYGKITDKPAFLVYTPLVFASAVLLLGIFYSLKVRNENRALHNMASIFLDINEIYRDTLKNVFSGQTTSPEALIKEEQETLAAITQRTEQIFSRLLGRNCTVTIKLLIEHQGRLTAETFTRSVTKCERDNNNTNLKYEVGTGNNTSFDEAIKKRNGKNPSHYFSPDLRREKEYRNQRQDHLDFYKSVLVVPIRGINVGKEGTNDEFDNIGFLCVDTESVNRLNSGYQLFVLASLSNQIYNFMSLMRGNYTVYKEQKSA